MPYRVSPPGFAEGWVLLAGGCNLEHQEAPPKALAKRDRMAEVCAGYGVDLRAPALPFCAAHPVVAAIIAGANRADKVRENARLMAVEIPADFWDELRREGLIPGAPTPAAGP